MPSVKRRKSAQRYIQSPFVPVFDLDETLVHSMSLEDYKNHPDQSCDFALPEFELYVFERLGLNEILQTLHDYQIPWAVWTAGEPQYAKQVLYHLLKNRSEHSSLPIAVFARDKCVPTEQWDYVKPLMLLANHLKVAPTNFVIVEDNELSVEFNVRNWIPVRMFMGPDKKAEKDKTMELLSKYLLKVQHWHRQHPTQDLRDHFNFAKWRSKS